MVMLVYEKELIGPVVAPTVAVLVFATEAFSRQALIEVAETLRDLESTRQNRYEQH